jgi:hypothetical protein
MRFELIAQIILILSFFGISVIIFRKIPVLLSSPEVSVKEEPKIKLFKGLKERIKNSKYFKADFFEILLQKIISKTRILSLKMENKTADWLKRLRERSQRKKIKTEDNFWEELKKSTKEEEK